MTESFILEGVRKREERDRVYSKFRCHYKSRIIVAARGAALHLVSHYAVKRTRVQ